MKRGATTHPKVHTLAALLDVPRWGAVGLLESLWHFAQGYAQAGDVGRHTDEAIARAVGWEGNASTLISAFATAAWVDRCACHRLRIHDWQEHADQTVERWLTDHQQWFLSCYPPASTARESRKPAVPCRSRAVPGLTKPVPPADAGAVPRKGGWPAEAAVEWNTRFGGRIVIGKLSKPLGPLVQAHGWPTVKAAWVRYLDDPEQEQKFKSPANFAERFAFWKPPPARAAPIDTAGLWHSRAPDLARTFQAWLKVNQRDGEVHGLAFYRWLEQTDISEADRESAAIAVSIELKRIRKESGAA